MGWKGAGLRVLRGLLWLMLAWIFVRGVASFVPEPDTPAAQPAVVKQEAAPEPAGLRSIPAMFAREYLTWQPGQADERAARLEPFLSRKLDRQAGWRPGRDGTGQNVEGVWVHSARRLAENRWLVTVAARVAPFQEVPEKDAAGTSRLVRKEAPASTLYLAIPLALTREGGVVVSDYPSLVPAPPGGEIAGSLYEGAELTDKGGRVESMLGSFFRVYLSGSAADMAYYLSPESKLQPMQTHLKFEGISGVFLTQASKGPVAYADILVADPNTGSRFTYRYTLHLTERDGRWYIKDLLQKGD